MISAKTLDQVIDVFQKSIDSGLEVMLQEIIPGDDNEVVNYNAYFWNGEPLIEFTAQHIRNAPPWFGSPRVVLSKQIPEVLVPGRKILKALNFNGYACVEFKRDPRDGQYKLMEVNGRHNLSTLLAVKCGINFPWFEYKHLSNGQIPSISGFQTGIYWIDIFRDLGYSAAYLLKEHYSLQQYLKPYFNPHVFAIFDIRDTKPFFKRFTFLVKKAFQSVSS
jgi:predicted ATP-grasp superfamily ATP-dependent carboligase